jgi:hypothetical protein
MYVFVRDDGLYLILTAAGVRCGRHGDGDGDGDGRVGPASCGCVTRVVVVSCELAMIELLGTLIPRSYPAHTPLTPRSHPAHTPLTSRSHPAHTPLTPRSGIRM